MGLQPDVACKADPEGFKAWLTDTTSQSSLLEDACLGMAVQQLQLSGDSLAPLPAESSGMTTQDSNTSGQVATLDRGALWRAHVASVQAR